MCDLFFFRGVYFRGLSLLALAHFERGGHRRWKGDRETGELFFVLFFCRLRKKPRWRKELSHSQADFDDFLKKRFFRQTFVKTRSRTLARTFAAKTAHKMPLLRDFHEKYLQHRFNRPNPANFLEKSALFSALHGDKNKRARDCFDFPAKKFDFLLYF